MSRSVSAIAATACFRASGPIAPMQPTRKVLAVVVTRSGLVRDRVLRLDLPQADLDLAARYINENFRGWTSTLIGANSGMSRCSARRQGLWGQSLKTAC